MPAGLPEAMASPTTRKIGDRTYEIRPLTLADLGLLQRKALDEYKRTLMSGLQAVSEFIPEKDRDQELREERRKIMHLDHLDLPTKTIALDKNGDPTDSERDIVERIKVDYWRWWTDHTYEGQCHMVWLALCKAQPDVTVDYVQQKIMGLNLMEMAAVVAEISKANVGNAETPAEAA